MKKLLVSSALLALAPAFALAAAYNDVGLGSGAVISVGGITVNVSGASLQQLDVGASNFTLTLAPNSNVTLTAPNKNQIGVDSTGAQFLTSNQCDGGGSNVTLTVPAGTATSTVTVTPSSTICATASGSSSSSGGGGNGAPVASSGGGGGGGGSYTPTVTTPTTNTTVPSVSIEALKAQLAMLLAQLALLTGGSVTFSHDLQVGSSGSDVKALQVYLNGHGYAVAKSGAGSSGNETTKFGSATKAALAKFQKAVGISPASGFCGPKTRAYINAHL